MAKRKTFSLPNSDISLTRRKRSNTPASDALRVFESNWNRQSMAEYGRAPGGFVTHPVTPPPYDSDALAYFTAFETAGGSFDQTAVDPTYTESYLKTSIDNFVVGCKTDGVWEKMTEAYLMAGGTFAGLMTKLKGTGTLTNNNFVTGDYLGVGTGAGLTGDASTKYLDTGLLDSSLSADDKSFGAYITSLPTITPSTMMGSRANTPSQLGSSFVFTGVGTQVTYAPQPDCTIQITEASAFHATVSRRGVNDVEAYANGSSVGTDTSTASATGLAQEWFLFARNFNGSADSRTDATLTFAHVGTGLTDTDASNLSTRVNKLMYDLGCNTYYDAGTLAGLDSEVASYVSNVFDAGGDFE